MRASKAFGGTLNAAVETTALPKEPDSSIGNDLAGEGAGQHISIRNRDVCSPELLSTLDHLLNLRLTIVASRG
jgi:hypothetical protein